MSTLDDQMRLDRFELDQYDPDHRGQADLARSGTLRGQSWTKLSKNEDGRMTTSNDRWENEGGADRATETGGGIGTPVSVEATSAVEPVSVAIETRKDAIMTITSSDGRPPVVSDRRIGWKWFGAASIVVIAGIVAWVTVAGVGIVAILIGLGFGVLMLIGMGPVLGASVLRGSEERAAGVSARDERRRHRGW